MHNQDLFSGAVFPVRRSQPLWLALILAVISAFLSGAATKTLAQTPIPNGDTVSGAIAATTGDSDAWTFSATAGQSIFLRVGTTNFTPHLELRGPDDALVTEASAGNSLGRDDFVTAVASTTGTYTAVVSAKFAGQSGSYGLTLAQAQAAFTVPPGDDGGALANGAAYSGTITLGDLDLWSFNAGAGESLVIRAGTTNFTPWIRLYGPNGALIKEANLGNALGRDDFLTAQATNAGTYTVVVSTKFANQTGSYGLFLVRAPASFVVSPGDEGGPLENGALHPGKLPLGDLDAWSFNATGGEGIMLRVGATNFTPWIQLFGPDGALIDQANAGNALGRDDFLTIPATNSGAYTVVVSAKFGNQFGEYSLSFVRAAAEITVSPNDEGGPLQNGALNSGEVTIGDLDEWSFEASAGDSLMLRVGSTNFTPWIRLYGPNGAFVGEANTGNSLGRDDVLTFRAAAGGIYSVVVSAKFGNQFGKYGLTWTKAPGAIVVTPGDDGGVLTNGVVQTGTIALGDLDLWNFQATAGSQIMLRLGADDLTPWIRLYAPDGALAGEANAGNSLGRDDFLTVTATNAGTYTVAVGAKYNGQASPYRLTLALAPQPFVTSTGDQGGPLVNGYTNAASLLVGDVDVWSFIGTPGDSNVLRVTATSFTPWIRLVGPDGSLLAETRSGNTLARSGFVTLEVTNSGLYTVLISATYSGQSGDYTFKQSRVPPDLILPDTTRLDESQTLNVTISAQDPDLPGKELTFALLSAPPGVSLNRLSATNAALSWVTTEADGPSTNLVVATVTDVVNGKAFIRTNSFTVIVNEINTPPQLVVPPDGTLDELTPLQVTATASDADLPPNLLTFSLVSPPAGMTINPNTGAISWTPSEEQGPSSQAVTVVVTDSNPTAANEKALGATNTFQLVVREVNTRPQFGGRPDNATLDELATLSVTNRATDADLPANLLTYSLILAPPNAAISADGVITWTPSEAQGPSTNNFVTVVTDNGNPALTLTNTFVVFVRETNRAPVLAALLGQTVDELVPLIVTNTASDSDLPTNTLSYTLIAGPTNAVISSTGVISWTPTEEQGPSTNLFTTVVVDNGNPSRGATNSFEIIVREVNLPPVLQEITDRSLHFGVPLSIQALASDADLPANQLVYSIDTAPANLGINSTNGLITWTPGQDQVGNHPVTVRVSDQGSPAMNATVTFHVTVSGDGASLQIERLLSGLMQLRVTADTGYDYELQKSVDLESWEKLFEFRLSTSPFAYIDPDSTTTSPRFYRLKLIETP